jgi:4-hydroxy-2-oxoglutarate aldolase
MVMAKYRSGVMPPLATPFKNEQMDLEAFKSNLDTYNQTGMTGYLVLGSNGEAAYLSKEEKQALIAAAREVTPEDRFLLVGAGAESSQAAIEDSTEAARLGADAVLVLPPCYYKGLMDDQRLAMHYKRLADNCPIPVMIYNMPANTGLNLSAALVGELAAHPNIMGIKDSSGNMLQLSEIVRLTKDEHFITIVGASPMLYPALCLGAAGGILAVANVLPNICVTIFEAFQAGDHAEALALHQKLTKLAMLVTSGWGVPGLKHAMNKSGYDGGNVRSPLTDLTDSAKKDIIEAELGILLPLENR